MKLSPGARAKLGVLEEARAKWDHVRALVERAASRKTGAFGVGGEAPSTGGDTIKPIGRAAIDVAELLAAQGFAQIADDVRELHTLARRGEAIPRSGLLRMKEVVSNVSHALQNAQATVIRDDAERDDAEAG